MEEELEQVFAEEIRKDVDKAFDLYRSLAGNAWVKEGLEFSFSWKGAAEVVSGIRTRSGCPYEDYADYYLSGSEGEVASWLRERLGYLGYTLSPGPISGQ